MSKSTQAISEAINLCLKRPILFLPALAPIIIQVIFLVLGYVVFPTAINTGFTFQGIEIPGAVYYAPNPWLIWGGYFLAALFGFIASCMVIDMANDSINARTIDLGKSLNFVTGKLGTLIVAAIIAALCAITFVLFPVALFIITIAVIEGTDAVESTKRSINFVLRNLGEVIVFIIIVIVVAVIFGIGFALIPVVGPYLGAILNWIISVVWAVAALSFYHSLRGNPQETPLPPPPPPPPTY